MAIFQNASGGESQHIHGGVDARGNKMWGDGFRSKQLGTGAYVIEFDRSFSGQPTAVCTIYGNPWYTFNISVAVIEINPWQFICFTSKPGDVVDCDFTFIAFGDL
ncbi:MAG: hypothetical protein SXA11_11980 [Cyanobacteriota bacterium]|nr:hypothetical protein [Cyanobacteriota bacterium]